MPKRTRNTIIALVIGLGGAAAVSITAYIATMYIFEVDVTLTWLDAETKQASIEFNHPRTGQLNNRTVLVPDDCEITLNDEPADLSQLVPGDTARVRVKYIRKTKTLQPIWVRIQRTAAAMSTEPATDTATEPVAEVETPATEQSHTEPGHE